MGGCCRSSGVKNLFDSFVVLRDNAARFENALFLALEPPPERHPIRKEVMPMDSSRKRSAGASPRTMR